MHTDWKRQIKERLILRQAEKIEWSDRLLLPYQLRVITFMWQLAQYKASKSLQSYNPLHSAFLVWNNKLSKDTKTEGKLWTFEKYILMLVKKWENGGLMTSRIADNWEICSYAQCCFLMLCYRSSQSTCFVGTRWAAWYNRSCPCGCAHDRHPYVWGPEYQHEDGGGSGHGYYPAV